MNRHLKFNPLGSEFIEGSVILKVTECIGGPASCAGCWYGEWGTDTTGITQAPALYTGMPARLPSEKTTDKLFSNS